MAIYLGPGEPTVCQVAIFRTRTYENAIYANFLELRKAEGRRIPLPRTPMNKAGTALPLLRVLALADRVVGRRPNTSAAKERIDGFQDLQEHLGRGLRPLRSDQRFRGRREASGPPA